MNDLVNIDPASYINNELRKFNITDLSISEMRENCMAMKISGIHDKVGYEMVREARISVKAKRVEVDKKRKELTADALTFQRAINKEAARITELLSPIENYLSDQEKSYEDEKERIKLEKERLEQEKFQNRIDKLSYIGFVFNGAKYISDSRDHLVKEGEIGGEIIKIGPLELKLMSDDVFDRTLPIYQKLFDERKRFLDAIEKAEREEADRIEKIKKEEEERNRVEAEASRKLEQERLDRVRKEQDIERQRLELIAKSQEEKERALNAEKEKLELKTKQLQEITKEPEPEKVEVIDSSCITCPSCGFKFKENK